ncbi:MAG: CPBP family intramembrane glutamic endopeptidase, partial [Clostridium sp.]
TILFAAIPLIYCGFNKSISLKDYFKIGCKKQLLLSLLLGFGVYFFIIGAFLITRNFIDLSEISNSLNDGLNVSKNNFIYVAIYISFINSLLEEFFFRGFIFLSLKKYSSRTFSYLFSAFAFSLYHVAIIINWFNIFIFLLILFGLVVAGLLFNWLNEKNENIYNSWLVHMFANFAINTIGIVMFSII